MCVSCTPCCLLACINFHMIMHPDFSSQIALETISKNPNLKFPGGACPQGPRHKSMSTYPCMYPNSLQPPHFYLAVSSPDLVET